MFFENEDKDVGVVLMALPIGTTFATWLLNGFP